VAVLREWRDQGVASHLVNAVMMRARANGSRRAVLLTSTARATSRATVSR
jgi:amino-acid N-acetyltransferase